VAALDRRALAVIDLLDGRIAPLEAELGPLARADPRVLLLTTIPGVGELLGLTLASEIGEVARFPTPRKLIGYAGLAPRVNQSGDRSRTGALSKAGSRTLRRAGPRSRPPSTRGGPPTPGIGSTASSPSARARTPPRRRSRARS
jgi:transposase